MNWRVTAWLVAALMFALLFCSLPLCCGYVETCGPEWMNARLAASEDGTAWRITVLISALVLLSAAIFCVGAAIDMYDKNASARGAPDNDEEVRNKGENQ